MKNAVSYFFLLCVLNWVNSAAFAQEATTNSTRCEKSFGSEPIPTTLETCRLELTGPVAKENRLKILEILGKIYLNQNEPELAIATWLEASQYTTISRADETTAESWTRLQLLIGQTYAQADQMDRAEAHFKKSVTTVEKEVGKYSMPAGMVQDALGTFYAMQNKPTEAEAAFKRARIVYEVLLGKTNALTLETRTNHAIGLLDMGKEKDAMENFLVLAELINSANEHKNAPLRAEILTFLGTMQMRSDMLREAAKNYQVAFEVRQAAFGPNDIKTSQSLNNLGVVLFRAGDLKRAETALSKAYVIRADVLGNKDPLTLSTQKNLQAVIAAQKTSNSASAGNTRQN